LGAYLPIIKQTGLLPKDPQQTRILLEAHLLERAIQELEYELENGLQWLKVPLQGILWLVEAAG
jgi:maltose alpha-D-glucosyltransferase/alpha-amylase